MEITLIVIGWLVFFAFILCFIYDAKHKDSVYNNEE